MTAAVSRGVYVPFFPHFYVIHTKMTRLLKRERVKAEKNNIFFFLIEKPIF